VVQIHSPRPLVIRTSSNLHGKKMAKNAWIPTRRSSSRNERTLPNQLMPLSQPIPIHLITCLNHPACAERSL
jgi:hypothetical protein